MKGLTYEGFDPENKGRNSRRHSLRKTCLRPTGGVGFRGVTDPWFSFKSIVSLDLFVLLDQAKRTRFFAGKEEAGKRETENKSSDRVSNENGAKLWQILKQVQKDAQSGEGMGPNSNYR